MPSPLARHPALSCLLLTALLSAPGIARAALSVQDLGSGQTPAGLAATLLLGSGIVASNISYSGDNSAAGSFSGGNGIVGFDQGIILSSGAAANVVGPCDGSNISTSFNTPGDPALDLLAGVPTNDASVLEFDFVPGGSQLYFQYVFASVDYPEFVGSYNDPFGLYVNGVNTALVPGTSQAVTINDVNSGTNSAYYVDNLPCVRDLKMDGLTVVLGVTVTVNAGVPNHIKLAIADAGDTQLDSVVFLKAGSFQAPSPTPTRTPSFTVGPTLTPSPSFTVSPTPSITPTFSVSPTFTVSPTVTQTFSSSPTPTCTPRPLQLHPLPPNPNPAGPGGVYLPYWLPVDADVVISVYTVAGERVRRLDPFPARAGNNEQFWDEKNSSNAPTSSGIFLLHIEATSRRGETVDAWEKCSVIR